MYWSRQIFLHNNIFTTIDMNFHLPYDRIMKLLHTFLYDIWRVVTSLLLTNVI
jgi:hypothetical protein